LIYGQVSGHIEADFGSDLAFDIAAKKITDKTAARQQPCRIKGQMDEEDFTQVD
jgi:hypothetical protein